MDVQKLEPPDTHYLDAATGWLGLGCPQEAREELSRISPANQCHPDTLEVRWTLLVREERWDDALKIAELELKLRPEDPAGWLHRAYALRRAPKGGLIGAWGVLLLAAEKFPKEPVIAYNLSCYATQLKDLVSARLWLHRSIKVGDKAEIKKMALDDDDLKPLWSEIRDL